MNNSEISKNNKLFLNYVNSSNLKKKRIVYTKDSFNVQIKKHFSGSSPPEIFVGRYNYPYVNAGILSPTFFENTEELSMPEIWHEQNFKIEDILIRRSKLIYGRFKTEIKRTNKFSQLMQEIAMSYKPVSTEFFLKKPPKQNLEISRFSSIIINLAPLENARLGENPKINPKVEYLVSDTAVGAVSAINELYKAKIPISSINKILSAGLLGLKSKRKLVPTRWSITAIDDTISKELLKKIKYYPVINEILLFNEEYLGNHYEILLLPGNFSFEVIEAEIKNNFGNTEKSKPLLLDSGLCKQRLFSVPKNSNKSTPLGLSKSQEFFGLSNVKFWQDYEYFYGRKDYANEVIGAYYANRLALCEYLEKIKRQATAIFFREVKPEYYLPLGVGILREACRGAFSREPEKFNNLNEVFKKIQERLILNVNLFKEKSVILKDYGSQKKLVEWI